MIYIVHCWRLHGHHLSGLIVIVVVFLDALLIIVLAAFNNYIAALSLAVLRLGDPDGALLVVETVSTVKKIIQARLVEKTDFKSALQFGRRIVLLLHHVVSDVLGYQKLNKFIWVGVEAHELV